MTDIGLIGVGRMGSNHLRVLKKIRDCNLVGICDANKAVESLAKQSGVPFYSEPEKLLEKCDCADICVPTRFHHDMALKALDYCDVLLEKPISHSIESGRAIIEYAKKKGRKLLVGHIERFNPAVGGLRSPELCPA